MQVILTIIAAITVLFVPGFAASFVFFRKGKIDYIERVALSFALSIAIVPLIVFYTNIIGITITAASVSIQIGIVVLISYIFVFIRNRREEIQRVEGDKKNL